MAFNRQIILREDPIPARFAASTATIKKQSIIEEKTFFIGWSLSDDMRYLMDLTLIDRTFYVLIRKQAVKAANGGIPDTFRTWLNIGRSRGCPASLSTSPGYRRKREREREREREIQSTRSARALLPMRFLAPRLPRGPVEMSHNRAPPRNRKFTPLRNKWANSTSTLSLSLSRSRLPRERRGYIYCRLPYFGGTFPLSRENVSFRYLRRDNRRGINGRGSGGETIPTDGRTGGVEI